MNSNVDFGNNSVNSHEMKHTLMDIIWNGNIQRLDWEYGTMPVGSMDSAYVEKRRTGNDKVIIEVQVSRGQKTMANLPNKEIAYPGNYQFNHQWLDIVQSFISMGCDLESMKVAYPNRGQNSGMPNEILVHLKLNPGIVMNPARYAGIPAPNDIETQILSEIKEAGTRIIRGDEDVFVVGTTALQLGSMTPDQLESAEDACLEKLKSYDSQITAKSNEMAADPTKAEELLPVLARLTKMQLVTEAQVERMRTVHFEKKQQLDRKKNIRLSRTPALDTKTVGTIEAPNGGSVAR